MNRRSFIQSLAVVTSYCYLAPKVALAKAVKAILSPFISPRADNQFDGDNDTFPHEILWDKAGYLKKMGPPQTTTNIDVLIVGAGVGGLTAAYYLENKNIMLLEQAPTVGGNSKGHIDSDGTKRSIGAAYITIPDADSAIELYLKDLGLSQSGNIEEVSPVMYGKKFHENFKDILTVEEFAVFDRIQEKLKYIYDNEYPEIPFTEDAELTAKTLELDKISFADWLQREFGFVPDKIKQYYQMYCWSSFNGSIDEISAAQFLNFICSETIGVWAFAGGNAVIIEALMKKLSQRDNINIQADSFVADIKKVGSTFETIYIKDGRSHVVKSNKVIFASPKFIIDKVFDPSFTDIIKAGETLEYRAYLVAQVDLKNPITMAGYDQFIITDKLMPTPSPLKKPTIGFTDIINATWAKNKSTTTNKLTIYKPMPYQGAQQFLFAPEAYNKAVTQVKTELANYGIQESNITRMAVTRWGHSMPIAKAGVLYSNRLKNLQTETVKGLFFVGQDTFANPAFESAFETAYQTAAQIMGENK